MSIKTTVYGLDAFEQEMEIALKVIMALNEALKIVFTETKKEEEDEK